MAEVTMKRLTLAGLAQEKEEVLKQLAFFGAVEIHDAAPLATEEEAAQYGAVSDTAESGELRGDLEKLQGAIHALTPLAPKKGLLQAKPHITRQGMEDAIVHRESVAATADEVMRIQRARLAIAPDTAKMEGQILSLEPWLSVDIPLGSSGTKLVDVVYGTFPALTDMAALQEKISNMDCCVETVSSDKNAIYCVVLLYRGSEEECMAVLREFTFSRVSLREYTDTPVKETERLKKAIEENAKTYEALTGEISQYIGDLPRLQEMADTLNGRLAMSEIRTNLLVTEKAFFLTGFIPEERCQALEQGLKDCNVAIEFSDVTEDDDVPVLLKNNKFVEPYEMVTEMYSLPLYGGLDPNPFVAPFFFLFFGIMIADIGYGLILVLIGSLMLLKTEPQGMAKKLFTLALYGGISATIVGIITGSFFGDLIYQFTSTFTSHAIALKAFFDPLTNPIPMLVLSCALGAIHLLLGMALAFWQALKRKDYMGAFADIGLWWVVFAGIAFIFVSKNLGLSVMGVGALGLVLTQGRSKKGFISKLWSGILSLYNITSYLGDVLSYSRLMALGLSGAVIAQVFNAISVLLGKSVIGFIVFVLVALVGHALNTFLSVLGAYVHTSRLQYVEFFGKFYESGGRAFDPFKIKTQYYNLISKEDK